MVHIESQLRSSLAGIHTELSRVQRYAEAAVDALEYLPDVNHTPSEYAQRMLQLQWDVLKLEEHIDDLCSRAASLAGDARGVSEARAAELDAAKNREHRILANGLGTEIVAALLDLIEDARQFYVPEELIRAGFPKGLIAKAKGEVRGQPAALGLSVIEVLAEEVGVDFGKVPTFTGWQRSMRALKAAIRRQLNLPAVQGEED